MQKFPLTNNMLAVMKIKHELPSEPLCPMSIPDMFITHSRYVHVMVSDERISKVSPDWMRLVFEWRKKAFF